MRAQARRELDAWVITNVMEWSLSKEGYSYHDKDGNSTGFHHYPPPPAWAGCHNNYFCPTEMPGPALIVLGKCVERGHRIVIGRFFGEGGPVAVGKLRGEHKDTLVGYDLSDETLPLAICRMAKELVTGGETPRLSLQEDAQ